MMVAAWLVCLSVLLDAAQLEFDGVTRGVLGRDRFTPWRLMNEIAAGATEVGLHGPSVNIVLSRNMVSNFDEVSHYLRAQIRFRNSNGSP